MNEFEEESYASLNTSSGSLDLSDLHELEERKLSGIYRHVFVNYGMRSLMIRQDVDESLLEVKKAVEGKTGIPMDDQILALSGSFRELDPDQSLRSSRLMGGAFVELTTRA